MNSQDAPNEGSNVKGVALALAAGVLWGFSGTCAQFLFETYGLDATWMTAVRMVCAGAVLLAYVAATKRLELKEMWSTPRHVARLFAYAPAGLMLCQLGYLTTIGYSNAATATVLQFIGPVLVVVWGCLNRRKLPGAREVAAVVLAVAGTFVLATHGDPTSLVISPLALVWGLLTALAVAIYSVVPGPLLQRYSSLTVLACGMCIGGAVLFIGSQAWTYVPSLDAVGVLVLVGGLIVAGTIVGFGTYMTAIQTIGAPRSSLLASVEPLSAIVISVLWLGTSFVGMDYAGFVLIMLTVFLLAKPSE